MLFDGSQLTTVGLYKHKSIRVFFLSSNIITGIRWKRRGGGLNVDIFSNKEVN